MSSRNRRRHRSQSRVRTRRRRLLTEPLEDRRLLAVSFEFNYVGGNSTGFNDPSQGDAFRASLESAAARLGGWLLHDATVQMDVLSFDFDGTAVAKATSEPAPVPDEGGFVHGVIPAKIIDQIDLNDAAADGRLEVYFFGPSDTFTYVTDPSEVDVDDEIDFQAVIIHELVHTLGFTSATTASGSDDSGNGVTTAGTWTPFDRFLSDVDGNRLIDADPESATAFQMDTSATGWPTHSVGGKGPDAGLFFDGPIAQAVYGGRVPLYSPSTFALESSVSHLDSEGFPDGTFVFSPATHLMSHAIIDGTVPQELTLLEKAILADVGILLSEDVPPNITAPPNLIVEGNAEGGFLGLDQQLFDFLESAVATDLIDPNPTITHNKPAYLPLGQNTITFTATDASGNTRSATSVVSVFDTTPPTIDVTPATATFEATGPDGVSGVTLPFTATVSDIVDPNPQVAVRAGDAFPLGTTTATYAARDFRNNLATVDVEIIVQDTTAPQITLPAEMTINSNLAAGADLSNVQLLDLINAAASDTVDEMLSISAEPAEFPIGTTPVTFTVTDDSGNAATASTSLTVVDISLVVTTLDDELDADPESDLDDLSLREAIALANSRAGADVIRFETGLTGAVMFDSALGQLEITDDVSLFGLGRDVTSIDAQSTSRVIDITGSAMNVTIDGLTVTGGRQIAESQGGAGVRLQTAGTLTIRDAAISGNTTTGTAAAGAGVQVPSGDLVLLDTIISGNQTTGSFASGGGVWTGGGTVTVTRTTFSANTTTSDYASGAGLYVLDGAATISASTFADNSTAGNRAGGGALALLSTEATIANSTISGNSTAGTDAPGGGIRTLLTPLKLISSTVSGNTTAASSLGGGIYADRGDLDIDNSTITGNQAGGAGGGIGVPDGSSFALTIHNSVVAVNSDDGTAPDFMGTGVLADGAAVQYSLIGNNTGSTLAESQTADPTTGNIVGDPSLGGVIDPLLQPLADNGGPTQTHLMQENSPAIDAGDPTFDVTAFTPSLINDQRGSGFPRIFGDQVDIGATEVIGDLVISWPNPADIVFGTELGPDQLNASANVPGTFVYSPPAGTILDPGQARTLTATFTPDDPIAFNSTSVTLFINVLKAEPVITWSEPAAIEFGTPLDETQLNATANVPGTFVYSPPLGTILDAGEDRVLSVTFSPDDRQRFRTVSDSVFIDVTSSTPVLTWDDPADIAFGTPLSSQQLNATANVEGTFSYIPPSGVLLGVGENQILTVTFTPNSPNFDPVSTTVMIDITKADPVITWTDPIDIVAGTPLSEIQLNATANVAGTFTYDPIAGTVLDAGAGQQLTVTFTPTSPASYNVVDATVTINVVDAQDFGDAPSGYPVLLAEDGARHKQSSLFLGSEFDLDVDGQPSELADGDGVDDDGVFVIADLVAVADADTVASFNVIASETGKLDAWIDLNQDGDWDDPGEQIFSGVDVAAGENTLGFTIVAGSMAGDTAARFRLSSSGGLAPTGEAADGEVEDYLLTILDGASSPDVAVELVNGAVSVGVESDELVVRSGDVELFRAPAANLRQLSLAGGISDELLTIDIGVAFPALANGFRFAGGLGGNTLVIVGDGGSIDLTDPLFAFSEFRHLDLSSSDANRVTLDASVVTNLSPALKLVEIAAGADDEIIVKDAEDWRMSEPKVVEGRFILTANNVAGGDEMIEADLPRAWRNFLRPGDVNNDGSVTANDALRIINELGRRSFSDGQTQSLTDPLAVENWPNVYFDHNGDDRATALDALRVINDLARLSLDPESAEGERVLSAVPPVESTRRSNRSTDESGRETGDAIMVSTRPTERQDATDRSLAESWQRSADAYANASQDRLVVEQDVMDVAVDRLLADTAFVDDLLDES